MADHYTAANAPRYRTSTPVAGRFGAVPLRLPSGAVLLAVAWAVAWSSWEPVRHYTFFPLWLGYILTIDGLTEKVTGSSIWSRSKRGFVGLFAVSAPAWWIFELLNIRLDNWVYQLPHSYSWLSYHAQASLAFSTVIPAVFCTAELVRRYLVGGAIHWLRLAPGPRRLILVSLGGLALLAGCQLFPGQLFPVVWLSLFFLIDPIVTLLGGRSVAGQVRTGRWDTVLVLFVATLWCGFLWEMWNSRSMPRWTYELPYGEWGRVFEMPVLGYGGYLPFGLELYSLYGLVTLLLPAKWAASIRFDRPISSEPEQLERRS